MKITKKALWASGMSLLLCCVLLVGTTFAWYTDSVSNRGNKIEAGSLFINAEAFDVGAGGASYTIPGLNGGNPITFEETAQNLKTETTPIISETLWEPGKSNAKLITIRNDGTLAVKLKLSMTVTDDGLVDVLWFDMVTVNADGVVGTFERKPMSTLAAAAESLNGGETSLAAGQEMSFILVYGMNEDTGNEYQKETFAADFVIRATQDTVETDGFGNSDYDEGATLDFASVSTADQFNDALNKADAIILEEDITLSDTPVFTKDTTLNMNGSTLTINGNQSLKAAPNTTLTVTGDGTINGVLYADKNFNAGGHIVVNAGVNFQVNSPKSWAVYGSAGSTILINGGTYTSAEKGSGVIYMLGKSLIINNAVIDVGTDSVMNSKGIHSNASQNRLENVTVYGHYSMAADFNSSSASTVIRGGSFITDKKTDDGFLSATIRYQGALDIADAEITHIGNGILYSPTITATQVENLTCTNCTFIPVGDTTYKDIDYKH